jgi:hemerythrin-like metal-binding protein
MALLTWNERYSIGVKALDRQHAGIIQMLNDLDAATTKGQTQEIAGALMRKLVNYTQNHFSAEEAMMKASQYPGLDEHHMKHQALTREVEEFVLRFDRGDKTMYPPLQQFLSDWLADHILKTDREVGIWLNERGVH